MIKPDSQKQVLAFTFSIKHLLLLTAMIAVGVAIGRAYQENGFLKQKRDELLGAAGRLQVNNSDEVVAAEQPKVAPDTNSWLVHIPDGRDYKLCLGVGEFYSESVPLPYESVSIPSGQHRVTFVRFDSASQEFRYLVYIDGVQVIAKSMGGQWMHNNWSSASSIDWPIHQTSSPTPVQLIGQLYAPRYDYGPQHSFNEQVDEFVTRKGVRLWIDVKDREYWPESPFIGTSTIRSYTGVGFRDGFRFIERRQSQQLWAFTFPALGTTQPIMHIEPVFYTSDGNILSAENGSFTSWELSENADSVKVSEEVREQDRALRSMFLIAKSNSQTPLPIIELGWDPNRLNEMGIRIANTDVNSNIERWGVRISEGTEHLWREIRVGERKYNADEVFRANGSMPKNESIPISFPSVVDQPVLLEWQTSETLPLQVLERTNSQYGGFELYQGLPIVFGVRIKSEWSPSIAVRIQSEDPDIPGDPFPGGAVIDQLQFDFSGADRDWLWLQVKPNL
jgi:hypothetical protein